MHGAFHFSMLYRCSPLSLWEITWALLLKAKTKRSAPITLHDDSNRLGHVLQSLPSSLSHNLSS